MLPYGSDDRLRLLHWVDRSLLPGGKVNPMARHITNRTWLPEHIQELRNLVEAGASPIRAAARLKRSQVSVQGKAKAEGFPFQDLRKVKRDRLKAEANARHELGLK